MYFGTQVCFVIISAVVADISIVPFAEIMELVSTAMVHRVIFWYDHGEQRT